MKQQGANEATPRRVRKEPDERRDQILACARELFSRRPYTTVSNTEIAAAAGVSRGLLNHYFGTKRELYLAAVSQMMNVPPVPVPAFVEGASVRDRVDHGLHAWLELLQRNRQTWTTALDMTASGGDADLERILDRARDRAVDHMTEVVGFTALSRQHPEIRAAFRGYSAMAEATTREWLKYGRLTRPQVHLLLREVLLHLIEDVLPSLVQTTWAPSTTPPP
ncbi:DNA-binding transcriptional regulator, AcrR family [Thermomonospora echinospora]|uniref:DNA-binding transcriptional regulator, AcrR family n=1 Tax=Thermomonospora echinospora TaxID=1992 RepID=A0A1H5XCT3_9ACTN|nr:TetR/AcrR family transcriptional regulator [Thermomonospora echinospora]SEG09016.1 DNA-binding transcriptional regulator, AcrR family [Thermomonospora echinospora]